MSLSIETNRPLISLDKDGKTILHNGTRCVVVVTPNVISIGCSDIIVEAVRRILQYWEYYYSNKPKDRIIIQA